VMVMVMVMMVVVVEAARCDRTARLPLPTASAPAADHATAAFWLHGGRRLPEGGAGCCRVRWTTRDEAGPWASVKQAP
jgi:hypothetical protein